MYLYVWLIYKDCKNIIEIQNLIVRICIIILMVLMKDIYMFLIVNLSYE